MTEGPQTSELHIRSKSDLHFTTPFLAFKILLPPGCRYKPIVLRLLHIQLVIYESCTHATHLLITILLMKAPEAAFPPPPISIFVPVDFFPPLNVTPRRLLKCEKILISLIRSHRPSSLCDVLDSDECSVDVQPSLLSANSMLFTGDGEARNLHVSDVML